MGGVFFKEEGDVVKILMNESMKRFSCNQKGCCCKGWGIIFDGDDLMNLLKGLDTDEERAELIGHSRIEVDENNVVERWRMQDMENNRTCHYLEGDGRCGIHAKKGVSLLPRLCREFPVHSQRAGEEISVHFDAVCPEVLNQLSESDEPYTLVEVEPEPDSELEFRAQRRSIVPPVRIGQVELDYADLIKLRDVAIETLNTRPEPAIDLLGKINYAIARVANGELAAADFAIDHSVDVEPFLAFIDTCVWNHSPDILVRFATTYERFVWDLDLSGRDYDTFAQHLDPEGWHEAINPYDAAHDPFLRRYLAHRFFSSFDRSPDTNHIGFTYQTINHALATIFRYAAGYASWLDRPVDRTLLKLATGSTEYLYRALRFPPSSMPWFGVDAKDAFGHIKLVGDFAHLEVKNEDLAPEVSQDDAPT